MLTVGIVAAVLVLVLLIAVAMGTSAPKFDADKVREAERRRIPPIPSEAPPSWQTDNPDSRRPRGGFPYLDEVVVIDFETTGLDPSTDRIVAAAAVSANIQELIATRGQNIQYWQARFNPERKIPRAASSIHGIYDVDVKDEEPFRANAESLLSFIGSRTIIAHNADFDVSFLKAELKRCKLKLPPGKPLCTMKHGARMLGRSRVSLEVLARELGVGGRAGNQHDALEDAILTLKIATAMAAAQQGLTVSRMDVN